MKGRRTKRTLVGRTRSRANGLLPQAAFRLEPRDVRPGLVRKFVWSDMLLLIRLKVPAPPVHDQPPLLDEFCLVDVSGADVIALLVTHLPFNGCLRPQA